MENFELHKLEDRLEMSLITLPSGETVDVSELTPSEIQALQDNASIEECSSTCKKK